MDEELAQLILELMQQGGMGSQLGADPKAQKAMIALLQGNLNYGQDFNSSLFNPQSGILTNTYDPTLLAPAPQAQFAESTPLVDLYRNDTGTLGMVANGLYGGVLSPIAAQKMVMDAVADPASDLYGIPVEQVLDSVNALTSEVASNNGKRTEFEAGAASGMKPRDDVFAKAGLPSPLEQYDVAAGNVPLTAMLADRIRTAQGTAAKSQDALSRLTPRSGVGASTAREAMFGRLPSPGAAAGPQGAKSFDGSTSIELRSPELSDAAQRAMPESFAAPKSEDEAKAWARQAGVSEENARDWYRTAENNARGLAMGDVATSGSRDEYRAAQDRWMRNQQPLIAAEWERVLRQKNVKSGNPILDSDSWAGAGGTQKDAAKLAAVKPFDLPKAVTMSADRMDREAGNRGLRTKVDNTYQTALQTARRDTRAATDASSGFAEGMADGLRAQGRTPAMDALKQRAAMLKLLGYA